MVYGSFGIARCTAPYLNIALESGLDGSLQAAVQLNVALTFLL